MKQELISEFIHSMHKIRNYMMQKTLSSDERAGTALQFQAMKIIKEKDDITVGEIALYLNMSSGAIAQLIERLCNKNWIDRVPDQNDKRIIHLSLTETGKEELIQMKEKIFKKISKFLELIPEKDVEELIRIQKDLISKLEEQENV